jgi:hypothetical protein
MTQLTKVSTKPDHLSDIGWLARLAACREAEGTDDGRFIYPNLYGAIFIDLTTLKVVTTIIFNDETDREPLNFITQSFEKIHNILTRQA